MKQVVQATSGGAVELVDAPPPELAPTQVLVRTTATLISAGTERAVTQLAQTSLLGKAKARPDLVRQVFDRARSQGIRSTIATVRTRLNDDIPLGYSGAGVVVQVGDLARGVRPGQLVATAGAGYANHAEYQAVPATLVSPTPEGVTAEQACFSAVASVAMHGYRQAGLGPGSKVVVVGLGLIGQLTARIAMASGCDVAGIDVNPSAIARANATGVLALQEAGDATTQAILEWSRGRGADAVLITAGTPGDSRIIRSVAPRCRDRAVIVAIGDIGLDLDRRAFYDAELELRIARSYGPGRYDPSYEEWAVDYPAGYVRWTEGRNLEAFQDMLASKKVSIDDLVSHRFEIDQAPKAYQLLDDPGVETTGIVLQYPHTDEAPARTIVRKTKPRPVMGPGIGICGAGLFTRTTIIPSLRAAGLDRIVHISSSSGVTAARVAEREDIATASSGIDAILDDPDVELVVIATPHSSHADLTCRALAAGKHVYVEKPLAITEAQLHAVEAALVDAPGQLYVGFNRRWSPMVTEAKRVLARGAGPITVQYRVNAGPLPAKHWYADPREGGRLLGECCHFIDTANALVDRAPVAVTCAGPNTDAHDTYVMLIEYDDGSVATITYAADAHPRTPKERCEITGRKHTIVIDDYQTMTIDGEAAKTSTGKGHVEGLEAFRRSLSEGTPWDPKPVLATSSTALVALRQLKKLDLHTDV
jgi:predicted dehydrogenase